MSRAPRLDSVQQMNEGSADPVGTLREIKAIGLHPLRYGSCSQQTKANKGCRHFDHPEAGPCPVLQALHDRGRPGYENVAFIHIKARNNWKQDAVPCHSFMDQFANADPRNGTTQILGFGGDITIEMRGSKEHPTNPRMRVPAIHRVEVPKMPRPAKRFAEVVEMGKMAHRIAGDQNASRVMGGIAGVPAGLVPQGSREPEEMAGEKDFDTSDLEKDLDIDAEDDLSADEDFDIDDGEPGSPTLDPLAE